MAEEAAEQHAERQTVQPYQVKYAQEIAREMEEIKNMRQEDGSELPNKRVKTLQKGVDLKYKKLFAQEKLNAEAAERQQKQLEFKLTPPAGAIQATRVHLNNPMACERAEVFGWCHRVRIQSKNLVFVTLRDGHGFCQVVLHGDCAVVAQQLVREHTLRVFGKMSEEPKAPGGWEIQADYFEIAGESAGDFENLLQADSGMEQRSKFRHILHRGDKGSAILKLRSHILQLFREHFWSKDFTEVNPPTIVNTACEGGSSLFTIRYYDEDAYMTQSSQFYLESVIHAVGDVFCIAPSYRAEKANTRRHLAEFTHLETEHAFIEFDDLLYIIEDMVCYVANGLYERYADLLRTVQENPIHDLKKPFRRMTYVEAIAWLNERHILTDDGKEFQFGDDIAESQERKMIDEIGEPVFLCKFPASLKAFYMPRCKEDDRLTDSVDLLVPGVGEIVGGSMRIPDLEATLRAYEREHIPLENYYWYTDVRKYGANMHGGCGLGLDRFVCWLLGIYNIRDSVMYPRAYGTLMP